jgi:hypothetical protein
MSKSSCFPSPIDFFKNEINTLERISSNPIFKKNFSQLVSDTDYYLDRNQKSIQKIRRRASVIFNFDFQSRIDGITINDRPGTAHIGALMKAKKDDYEILSYYFMLCDSEKVIRKFHFDYTPENIEKRVPCPIFHIQYPGKLSDHLLSLNLAYDHLECGLSEPRISFMPMSLALTINLLFKEFRNEETHRAIEDSTWRELIKKNETDILRPYFRKCNTFFSAPPANKLFTNDYCYGSL